jgi:small GTP-binding protein
VKTERVKQLIEQARRSKESSLDLSETQLTTLPHEVIKLKDLRELDLSRNQLTLLPHEISEMKNLKKLCIYRNNLALLPPEISLLKNLTSLDISENKLTTLPSEITDLGLEIECEDRQKNNIIFIKDNPLEIPPLEIVKKGRGTVIDFFRLHDEEKEEIREVKVLLVGEGGSGKTSLMNILIGEKFNEKESATCGINIKKWIFGEEEKKVKVNFWDFGGQEIMYATHQFFLTRRSLYILVLDSRKEEKTEYWLKLIRSFGGDSPVFIVINKIDENPLFDVKRKSLKEKYPYIKGFFRISCKKNEGVEEFKDKLIKELARIDHIQIKREKSWLNVKTILENTNSKFVSYENYKKICNDRCITDEYSQNMLIDYLNDLGVVTHFKEFSLLDTHVLEPRWITEAVYRIINSEKLVGSGGVLKLKLLGEILKKEKETDFYYSPPQYNYIINLMKKFELCYEIDEETILLPDLLYIQEPYFYFNDLDALNFLIQYDYLPKSVMPRFIVKMHKDIINNLQWRTGVVLKNRDFRSSAVIKADEEAKKIYMYVCGKQKRDYLAAILRPLREINQSFEDLNTIEKIPLPDKPEVSISYEHLVRLENNGKRKYMPDGADHDYDVRYLLGAFKTDGEITYEDIEDMSKIICKLKDKSDTEDGLKSSFLNTISINAGPLGINTNELSKFIKKVLGKMN